KMSIRRAKLVCTLGPACDSVERLGELIEGGMDVARFNFSHGSHEEHGGRLARLKEASAQKKKSVAALQDLCGPKVRTGVFAAPFALPTGSEIVLFEGDDTQDERRVPVQYEGLVGDVRVGDKVLFDDGRIGLTVTGVTRSEVVARVDQGGGMRNHVGVHLP